MYVRTKIPRRYLRGTPVYLADVDCLWTLHIAYNLKNISVADGTTYDACDVTNSTMTSLYITVSAWLNIEVVQQMELTTKWKEYGYWDTMADAVAVSWSRDTSHCVSGRLDPHLRWSHQ